MQHHYAVFRQSKWFCTVLISGLALFLGSCDSGQKTQNPAGVAPVNVGIVILKAQNVTLTTELPGRTTAYFIAEVRPQVGGIIQKRLFTQGSDIKEGELLYQIDPTKYQASYDNAKATLEKDEATLTAAQLKFNRYKNLVKINAVSQEAYDDAEAALKQDRATVAMDKATLELARIDLDYTRVVSPISGRIGRSNITPGALVTAEQSTALATVRQLDPIYVDVTQSSAQLLRLRKQLQKGQLKRSDEIEARVGLILEDGSTYGHEGQLQFSEVSVDESTGTVTLRAVFPNPEHELLPGMYVRAVVSEGVKPNAILAPQRSVTRDAQGKASALVLTSAGKVEQRDLEIARALGDQWLVTSGLKSGDQLIVDGLQKVKAGATAHGVRIDQPATGQASDQN